MLYFSETVCVLISSSLPALEGALESSNGDANGLCRLSLMLSASEAQLLLLEDIAEVGREGLGLSVGESVYGRGTLPRDGGSNISEDPWTDEPYTVRGPCNRFLDCKPGVGGKLIGLSDRMRSTKSPPLPLLTVICGGLRPCPNPPGVAIVSE